MLAFCLRLLLSAHRQPYHQHTFFYTIEVYACRSFPILSISTLSAKRRLPLEVFQERLLKSSSREESPQEPLNLLFPLSISSDRTLRYARPPSPSRP